MIDKLQNASRAVEAAIEQYFTTCLAICEQHTLGGRLDGISDIICDEMAAMASWGAKIGQTQNRMARLRNRCPKIVPINSLPLEILARIFQFAHKTECCSLGKIAERLPSHPSKFPESIASVCSHWRTLALGSSTLWTHIDLDISQIVNGSPNVFGREQRFAIQAGESPLYIHVSIGLDKPNDSADESNFLYFCTHIASRARSIRFEHRPEPTNRRSDDWHITVLETLISNCVPRKLKQFALVMDEWPRNYDEADSTPHRIEEILLRVGVLRSGGNALSWTSLAYSGLVELEVTRQMFRSDDVTISQLAGVLKASPRLRLLSLNCQVVQGDGPLPAPLQLDNLEVLYMDLHHARAHEMVLHLIHPGSRPLRMYSQYDYNDKTSPLLHGEYGRFLARSNVVELHLYVDHGERLELPRLLSLIPKLRALVLVGAVLESTTLPDTNSDVPQGAELPEIQLLESGINADTFRWASGAHQARKMKIGTDCWLQEGSKHEGVRTAKKTMLKINPEVEFLGIQNYPKFELGRMCWF